MENLYKEPKRFNELSNILVVFRFSFFTLAIQLSLSYKRIEILLLLFLLYHIRYSKSLKTKKISRAQKD